MIKRRVWLIAAVVALAAALLPTSVSASSHGFLTSEPPAATLNVPGTILPIINAGESVDGVQFQGIPDGIGLVASAADSDDDDDDDDDGGDGTVDVYVSHEETTVPFFGTADFQDASITKWTLDTSTGAVLSAEIAISSDEGFLRFCSAWMGSEAEGFDTPVYFANEETSDIVAVPPGASYQPDPAIAPLRQGGYAVALDTATGKFEPIAGMGRHNHENTVGLPGYDQIALLSTDDTFTATTSQLYLYLAKDQKRLFKDKGTLWAFRVTHKNGAPVDATDPFNDANDYLDLGVDDEIRGEFIRVPKQIARGQTGDAPQAALENWSIANNVFTFIRLEDVAVDKNDDRVVYVADTGASRVKPDAATGRLNRDPGPGFADNGRIFQFVFDDDDPKKVDSFTVYADGDAPGTHPKFVAFESPDNIDTSVNSLMVQEDADFAQIWQNKFSDGSWTAVVDVVDIDGESSGIVDASAFFGPGTWLFDVQAHSTFLATAPNDNGTPGIPGDDYINKLEDGQLLLLTIPGS